ncbi:MAG TPA: GlpM family protein [Anaeromyxobacteraceae bacterium]|nr:GlpM family protein [Anaeromyxobacteraceae bacterium]
MNLIAKAVLGGVIVLLIGLVSRSRNYYLAGLLPLFPTFALMAHYIVGTERSVSELKSTILFGMWGLVPFFLYFATLYFLVDRVRLALALGGSVAVWCAAAAVVVLAWKRT